MVLPGGGSYDLPRRRRNRFRAGFGAGVAVTTSIDPSLAFSRVAARAALDCAPVAILVFSGGQGLLFANPAARSLFGDTWGELTSLSLQDFLAALQPRGAARPALEADGIPSTLMYETILTRRVGGSSTMEVPVEVTLCRQQTDGDSVMVAYVADVSQRRLLQDRDDRQARRLASLHAIDLAITGSLDLRVTLDVILDHITAQLGVDAADVLLFDSRVGRLEFGACRGFRTDALKHTNLPLGRSFAGTAALERRMVTVSNLWDDRGAFNASPLLSQEGFVAYAGIPLVAKGYVKGVLEVFHRSALHPDEEWERFAEALAQQAAIAIENASLLEDLQHSNLELSRAYDTTLEGWSRALDLRDRETEGHSERVTDLAMRLAREAGLRGEEILHVRRGSLLHDIGKMGIPDGILLKPGPLTEEEWTIMRRHPEHAYAVLSPIRYLRPAIDIPYCHHERWDGGGYPRGLRGDEIPMTARIFAVVDVWDALTSTRPYRPAWSRERAAAYLQAESGRQFDPELVTLFATLLVDLP